MVYNGQATTVAAAARLLDVEISSESGLIECDKFLRFRPVSVGRESLVLARIISWRSKVL